jgi:7-alpha-hydroxysteroid dehydrogenase
MLEQFSLTDQVAVVTGSGRGIGRGIALGLAEAGAHVVVTARRENEIEAVAAEIRDAGGQAIAVPADVTTEEGNERIAAAAIEAFGQLDIWVSNAGGSDERVMRQLIDTPLSSWNEQIGLNLTAVFVGARTAARNMNAGATIINIGSMVGMRPSPGNGPYAAAKSAVINLTSTLAAELAASGIRVNSVAPGPVPTEVFMEALNLTEEQLPGMAKMVPLGRLGQPEDVAAAVVYLASPAASWVTGQTLSVTGGMS